MVFINHLNFINELFTVLQIGKCIPIEPFIKFVHVWSHFVSEYT
jgi:hypothetical protein